MKKVVKGFANLATGNEKKLSQQRMLICRDCHVSNKTQWCLKARGGCGCYLPAKTRVPEEECPKNKW